MKTLPEWMYIDGTVYYYEEWQGGPGFEDLYFCRLYSPSTGEIPYVKGKNRTGFYLCSAEYTMEEAHADLLLRINSMKYD